MTGSPAESRMTPEKFCFYANAIVETMTARIIITFLNSFMQFKFV